VIHYKFGGPIHISGMAEARAVKFCTMVGYIKSYEKNKKSPQKGHGYGHVTYLNSRDVFIFSEISNNILEMVQDRHSYNGGQIENHTWATKL